MASEKLYEIMFLVDSSKYHTDADGVVNHLVEIMEKAGGNVVAHRPWKEDKLAYEIEGHRKGLHYIACFSAESTTVNKDITRACKLSDIVIRQLIIRHPPELFNALVEALGAEGPYIAEGEEEPEASSSDSEEADEEGEEEEVEAEV